MVAGGVEKKNTGDDRGFLSDLKSYWAMVIGCVIVFECVGDVVECVIKWVQ